MSPLDTTVVNYYKKFSKPTVLGTVTLREWLNAINKCPYTNKILDARSGKKDYELTKASLPVVTYNFLYREYKKDKNIESPTGLLYFDIDTPEFNIESLDKSKIFVLHHSFGGRGYVLLVRVEGLTVSNFKSVYKNIAIDLGIDHLFDTNAAKHSQYNTLSHDTKIFINEDCIIYEVEKDPTSVILSTQNSLEKDPTSVILSSDKEKTPRRLIHEEDTRYITEMGSKIPYAQLRFTNLTDYEFTCDYIVNWSGFTFIHCYIPFKNKCSNKYKTLLSYCTNLVWLNPSISYSRTYKIMSRVNDIYYDIPSKEVNVKRVVDTVFKQTQEGTLKPIQDKPRYIIFDHTNKSKLSTSDKLEICRDELIKKNILESKQKLAKLIDEWNLDLEGKITIKGLAAKKVLSKNTIDKYYSVFREAVKIKNSKL